MVAPRGWGRSYERGTPVDTATLDTRERALVCPPPLSTPPRHDCASPPCGALSGRYRCTTMRSLISSLYPCSRSHAIASCSSVRLNQAPPDQSPLSPTSVAGCWKSPCAEENVVVRVQDGTLEVHGALGPILDGEDHPMRQVITVVRIVYGRTCASHPVREFVRGRFGVAPISCGAPAEHVRYRLARFCNPAISRLCFPTFCCNVAIAVLCFLVSAFSPAISCFRLASTPAVLSSRFARFAALPSALSTCSAP